MPTYYVSLTLSRPAVQPPNRGAMLDSRVVERRARAGAPVTAAVPSLEQTDAQQTPE